MWNSYSKPLIDAALPKGLLDYYDFHAYDGNGFPQVRMHAVSAHPGILIIVCSLVTNSTQLPHFLKW